MKKIGIILTVLLLVGCGNLSNTPIKQVEAYFKKYQSLDSSVIKDLDDVINEDVSLTAEQKNTYRDIMKKHYQNLVYEIKDDKIDGDEAIVTVEITVTDFNKVLDEASEYLFTHPEDFNDEDGNYDIFKYNDYRLNKLKETKEKVKYTLYIPVTKVNGEWRVNQLDGASLEKINGIYKY